MAYLQSAPTGYGTFGGGSGEDTRDKAGAIDVRDSGGDLIELSVWDAPVGGTRITDLLDCEGNPTAGTVSPIGDPLLIDEGLLLFYAPGSFPAVYLDRGILGSLRIALWQREMVALLPTAIAKANASTGSADAAAASAADSAASAADAIAASTATQAQQTQLMAVAATIDDLTHSVMMYRSDVGATDTVTFASIMQPATIVDFAMVIHSDVPASATDYWTIGLYVCRGGVTDASPLVSKTTKPSSGEAIGAEKSWSFAGATFDPALSIVASGDVLRIAFTKTGAPATIAHPLIVSWRAVPK